MSLQDNSKHSPASSFSSFSSSDPLATDDPLLYLAEMFPDLPLETIDLIIAQSAADASPQQLVDRCLEQQDIQAATSASSSPQPASSSSSSSSSPHAAFEMTSLLPASTTAASFAPSAPVITPQHHALLNALAALHGHVLSSSLPPASLLRSVTALSHLISNLLEHPDVEKYRFLSLSNAALQEKVLSLPGSRELLQAVGFREVKSEQMMILTADAFNRELLSEASKGLNDEKTFLSSRLPSTSAPPAPSQPQRRGVRSIVDNPLYKSKRQWQEEVKEGQPVARHEFRLAPTPRLSREQLAAVAEHRLHPKSPAHPPPPLPAGSSDGQRGRQMRLEDVRRRRDEVQLMRREKAERWRTTAQGRHRVITLDDLERMRREEVESRQRMGMGMGSEAEYLIIAKETVRLTNVFRREQGREPDVEWSAEMAEIGWKHSKNMGEGEVAFGHDGFSERAKEMRMSSAGENVFMVQGVAAASVAKLAVDGWANSPGHRRNMLGNWRFCGIGVYRNGSGGYYLTQLFANP
jgi:hypothetical protein